MEACGPLGWLNDLAIVCGYKTLVCSTNEDMPGDSGHENELTSPVHKGNQKLKYGCDRHPNKVRQLCKGDPGNSWPNDDRHPDDGSPNHQNIDGCQREISQSKLDRCKNQVCDQVDTERQGSPPRYFTAHCLDENESKCKEDDWIKNLPNRADRRWCWRPSRFVQRIVPIHPCHVPSLR